MFYAIEFIDFEMFINIKLVRTLDIYYTSLFHEDTRFLAAKLPTKTTISSIASIRNV